MLNELLEDYQEYNEDEALEEFIRLLWASKYGLRTYKRYYTFKVQESALDNNKELIELFEPYQSVELKLAKSFYQEKMNSIDMIRIHINNMYMYLTDKEVYLSSDYYRQLKIPKQRYYDTIKSIKEGKEIDIVKLKEELENSKLESSILKEERLKKKIDLSFKEYKEIINNYILRLFNNYKTPEQYEEEYGWELDTAVAGWHEDNYIVKYFCKSLTGYMMNYINESKMKEKMCSRCEETLSQKNRSGYCATCYIEHRKEKRKDYNKKYYLNIKNS